MAASYDIEYRPEGGGATLITGISGSPYTLGGLNATSNYEWRIRGVSTDDSTGVRTHDRWSAWQAFATTVQAIDGAADHQSLTASQQAAGGDVTAPVITLLGGNPELVKVGTTWVDPGVEAFDDKDGDLSANVQVTGAVNTAESGIYILEYDVSDSAGNPAETVTREVHVAAEEVATSFNLEWREAGQSTTLITGLTASPYTLGDLGQGTSYEWRIQGQSDSGATSNWTEWQPFETAALPSISATGDHQAEPAQIDIIAALDGAVAGTSNVQARNATQNVSAFIRAALGGTASHQARDATQVAHDGSAGVPVVTLNGSALERVRQGEVWVDPGATAEDPEDGALPITTTGSVNTDVSDVYTVTYSAEDSDGFIGTAERTVVVDYPVQPDSFELEWRPVGGSTNQVSNLLGTSYSLTDLTADGEYEWRLRGKKGGQFSDWSAWQSFRALLPTIAAAATAAINTPGVDNLRVTVNSENTSESHWEITGACNRDDAHISLEINGSVRIAQVQNGQWRIFSGYTEGLSNHDEFLHGQDMLLLSGDAQESGSDGLIYL